MLEPVILSYLCNVHLEQTHLQMCGIIFRLWNNRLLSLSSRANCDTIAILLQTCRLLALETVTFEKLENAN
jgi:hypothetical protein